MCAKASAHLCGKFMSRTKDRPRQAGAILLIARDKIVANPDQPRKHFDKEELDSLAESIRLNGILQPISVKALDDGRYRVIAGERRLRAAQIAGLQTIPCILFDASGEKAALYALIENLQRCDLSFFEEAAAICSLMSEYGLSQEETAKRLGKAQSTLSNKLRLLKLPEDVRQSILDAGLTERHARALLKLEGEKNQRAALRTIIKRQLNVSSSEKLIEDLLRGEKAQRRPVVKLFKDVRIFINTINHAVDTMREAGINADSEQTETEDYLEYVIRIPKSRACYITPSRQNAG